MAENTNISLTIEAWAEIVIQRWEQKISRLGINHTGKLVQSFSQTIRTQANGNPEMIQFAFNYYGKFVDMGVGRGIPLDRVQFSNRKAKPWYSKTFFSQIEKLKDILVEKYSQKAKFSIIQVFEKS